MRLFQSWKQNIYNSAFNPSPHKHAVVVCAGVANRQSVAPIKGMDVVQVKGDCRKREGERLFLALWPEAHHSAVIGLLSGSGCRLSRPLLSGCRLMRSSSHVL